MDATLAAWLVLEVLHGIGDVDRVARDASAFKCAVEHLAGRSDKGTPGQVLLVARLLADKGIRVNAVAPGPIWTPLIPASFDADSVAKFGKDTPLGRAGQPNEVAPCHLFLACEDSSYMTGQVLHPNGGEMVGG